MELTQDHTEARELLFPRQETIEFSKMPVDTFARFLEKADAAYYEGDVPDKDGNTGRKNLRWADYTARDHEYSRPYAVVGVTFFARLINEQVKLANQHWLWHPDFSLRWWHRRKYNVAKLHENHAMQNFREDVEFPEMVSAEEARGSLARAFADPALSVRRGHSRLRRKRARSRLRLIGEPSDRATVSPLRVERRGRRLVAMATRFPAWRLPILLSGARSPLSGRRAILFWTGRSR